jgi:hypothetical protein
MASLGIDVQRMEVVRGSMPGGRRRRYLKLPLLLKDEGN